MAVQSGLCGTRSNTQKTGFLTNRPIIYHFQCITEGEDACIEESIEKVKGKT